MTLLIKSLFQKERKKSKIHASRIDYGTFSNITGYAKTENVSMNGWMNVILEKDKNREH